MKRIICSVALVVLVASALAPKCAADDPLALVMKHEGHTVSLDLKFSKKNRNTLQHAISLLDWGPNGYATGFVVGDGLAMTAFHVVSGSPVYNEKAEVVGVFSGYDWANKLAVISPGEKAQKLLEDYNSAPQQ